VHDFNGGILPSGLFWTVDLRKTAVDFKMNDRRAVLHAKNVPVIDTFQIFGPFDTPALVDFKVKWEATGPAVPLGSGDAVPATDPAAFLGAIAPARAEGSFSGEEIGFTFESNVGASSSPQGYAELGTERNGVFL
jgi:hypothetical protein